MAEHSLPPVGDLTFHLLGPAKEPQPTSGRTKNFVILFAPDLYFERVNEQFVARRGRVVVARRRRKFVTLLLLGPDLFLVVELFRSRFGSTLELFS